MGKKCLFLIICLFLFVPCTFAKTLVEDADVCELKEVYRDADSIEDAIGKNEYLDYTIGNQDYCPVYCVERNDFIFPGFMPTVSPGGHFTWTIGENVEKNILSGYTANLIGKRNCRTKIDLTKWVKDYNDNLSKIRAEVATLKTSLQNGTVCPPNLGSRGCGMKLIQDFGETDASASTSFVKAGGLSNYIAETANGGRKLVVNEHFGTLASDKYMNVYEFMPNSLWDADSEAPEVEVGIATVGYSYWMEHQSYYKTLCPCEWKNESAASTSEVGADITTGPNSQSSFDAACDINSEGYLKSQANGFLGTYTTRPADTATVTYSSSKSKCSSTYGGSSSSCDSSFWGVHESQTPEQAVQTKFSCAASATVHKTIKEETRYKKVPDGTYETCTGQRIKGKWTQICETHTKYRDEPYKVYVVTSVSISNITRNIGYISQEVCQGDTGMGEYKTGCIDAGPTCPGGYHIGSDGKCNKTNTSYLRSLLSKQRLLINILKSCSEWDMKYYDLDTDMYVDYEEPMYDRTEQLNRVLVNDKYEENHRIMGRDDINLDSYTRYYSDSGSTVEFWTCNLGSSNRNCKKLSTNISTYWISEYGKEYMKEFDYYMPDSFYNYVLLPNGISLDSVPKNSEYEKYGRFIDIGYVNYPVHFNTKTRIPRYNLDIFFDKVGYLSRFSSDVYNNNYSEINNKTVHVENKDGNKLVYDCEYNLKEGSPYCPSNNCGTESNEDDDLGTVRLVYRPISLENPFPGMNGTGRDTGSNWCVLNAEKENCKNNETNKKVSNYILNNRNTEGSSIYEKEPMYEITLTPAIIKKIRNYNEDTNYDDYNLSCSTEKGKEGTQCRSYFVSPDAAKDLEETGLDTMGASITGCGVDSDFYKCDKLDGYER